MIVGKTNVPELEITPFTESPTFGVTRNPWDLNRHARAGRAAARPPRSPPAWSAARSAPTAAARSASRPAAAACSAQAPARPDPDGAAQRAVARPRGLRPDRPARRATPRCSSTSPGDGEPLAPAAASGAGRLRIAHLARAVTPLDRRLARRRASAARSRRPPSSCAASATRSREVEVPVRDHDARLHRALPARDRRRGAPRCPTPSGSRAAPAASAGWAARSSGAVLERAARRGGGQRARDRDRVRARRRADDPDVHPAADSDRHLRGPRRGVDRSTATRAGSRTAPPSTTPASRRRRCRRASPPTASRSRSSSSAAPATRRRCLARRADRGRAAMGGPVRHSRDELAEQARARPAHSRATALRAPRPPDETKSSPTDLVSEADVAAEELIRERLLGRGPTTGSSARRAPTPPARAGCAGSSTRSTAPPTSSSASRSGVSRSRSRTSRACSPASSTTRCATSAGRRARDAEPTLDGEPLQPRGARGRARHRARSPPASATRRTCAPRRPRSPAACCRRSATSAAWVGAAIDLAWTAAGRYDAYYERGIKTWDYAAGALICECAGLVVRHLDPVPPMDAGLLVAPRTLADELASLVD